MINMFMNNSSNYLLIKKIRLITGLGILECKNALIKNNYNFNKTINYLKSYNKIYYLINNELKQGIIKIKFNSKFGIILEINCRTDFVSKNYKFNKFALLILNFCYKQKLNLNKVNEYFKQKLNNLIKQLGENIYIKKIIYLKKYIVYGFVHYDKIGVLISVKKINNNLNLDNNNLKLLCMHIISQQPKYISRNKIKKYIINKEFLNYYKSTLKLNNNYIIVNKIAKYKLNKLINELCLVQQTFMFGKKKELIKDFLLRNNIKIYKFIICKLGY